MKPGNTVDIDAAFEAGTPIDEAMNEAVQAAVNRHKLAGLPLVVWQDGRPAQVMATEIKSDVPAIVGSLDIVMGEIDR
jgi:hypothetical protein